VTARSALLFVVAAVAETGGAYRVGQALPDVLGQLAAGLANATGLRLPSRSMARTPTWKSSLLIPTSVYSVTFPTSRAEVGVVRQLRREGARVVRRPRRACQRGQRGAHDASHAREV
jgi:hypothetical protein